MMEHEGIFYGSYKGFVSSNEDPKGLGRIQVTCLEVYGDEPFDYWALPKVSYAGKDKGSFFIPDKGDAIWISFEKGDPRFPVWEGGWWVDSAPEGGDPNIKVLKTSTGMILKFDDKEGTVTLDQKDNTVSLTKDDMTLTRGERIIKVTDTEVSIVSDKISLGKDGTSDKKAVLGDDLKTLLENLMDAIEQITVPTAFGPSGAPINNPAITAIKNTVNSILSTKITLD